MRAFLGATFLFLASAGAAFGQAPPLCGPRSQIEKSLAEQYNERLRVQAIRATGSMLLIYVSDDDTTFTIASMGTTGNVCVLDSGQYWSLQKLVPSREG